MGRSVRHGLVLSSLAALAVWAAAPPAAGAQDAEDPVAIARAAYAEGQRLFEAGDFEGALAQFNAAWRAVDEPPPIVLLGIASAEERLGRNDEAAETLNRYLTVRPDAPDRAAIETRIAGLGGAVAPVPATVVFESTPTGASIAIDGEPSGSTTPSELTLEPGEHSYELLLDGHVPVSGTLSARAGRRGHVGVALEVEEDTGLIEEADTFAEGTEVEEEGGEAVEEEEAPPASNEPSAATWAMFATAGVALVAGTVFGFVALSRQSDFDVMPSASIADEGEAFALVADLCFGVTAAAGITAIVLYATDRPSPPSGDSARNAGPSIAIAPMLSPSTAGVVAAGSF